MTGINGEHTAHNAVLTMASLEDSCTEVLQTIALSYDVDESVWPYQVSTMFTLRILLRLSLFP